MRLLQSVLATLPQTKKPQRKFITHLLGLVLMLPGHATFRNLSRYSSYHERTFARWYDRPFDFVSLNKAAITQVIPPEHQQALVIDDSFIPKSGTHTYGLERFWNSRHRRSEKGLEVSAVAWLDITDNCAVTPICAISTKDRGTQDPGVPRPMTARSSGTTCHALNGYRAKKTTWCSTIKFNHVHLRRNPGSSPGQVLRVVLVVDTRTQRRAILFSTDTDFGCADALSWVQNTLPNRVSLQRRQAVYVSECLSSHPRI